MCGGIPKEKTTTMKRLNPIKLPCSYSLIVTFTGKENVASYIPLKIRLSDELYINQTIIIERVYGKKA